MGFRVQVRISMQPLDLCMPPVSEDQAYAASLQLTLELVACLPISLIVKPFGFRALLQVGAGKRCCSSCAIQPDPFQSRASRCPQGVLRLIVFHAGIQSGSCPVESQHTALCSLGLHVGDHCFCCKHVERRQQLDQPSERPTGILASVWRVKY